MKLFWLGFGAFGISWFAGNIYELNYWTKRHETQH